MGGSLRPPGLRPRHPGDLQRIGILLEAGRLSAFDPPDVRELRVHAFPGRLESSGVAAQRDDRVAGVEDLLDGDGESVPFANAAREDTLRHRVRPDIGIAVRIGKILGFVPDDARAHGAENGGDVACRKAIVYAPDQGDVLLRHWPSPPTMVPCDYDPPLAICKPPG